MTIKTIASSLGLGKGLKIFIFLDLFKKMSKSQHSVKVYPLKMRR